MRIAQLGLLQTGFFEKSGFFVVADANHKKTLTIYPIVPSNSLVGRKACAASTVSFGEQGCSPVRN
jgi:hypothetical protein